MLRKFWHVPPGKEPTGTIYSLFRSTVTNFGKFRGTRVRVIKRKSSLTFVRHLIQLKMPSGLPAKRIGSAI